MLSVDFPLKKRKPRPKTKPWIIAMDRPNRKTTLQGRCQPHLETIPSVTVLSNPTGLPTAITQSPTCVIGTMEATIHRR